MYVSRCALETRSSAQRRTTPAAQDLPEFSSKFSSKFDERIRPFVILSTRTALRQHESSAATQPTPRRAPSCTCPRRPAGRASRPGCCTCSAGWSSTTWRVEHFRFGVALMLNSGNINHELYYLRLKVISFPELAQIPELQNSSIV